MTENLLKRVKHSAFCGSANRWCLIKRNRASQKSLENHSHKSDPIINNKSFPDSWSHHSDSDRQNPLWTMIAIGCVMASFL
jgi:hypothetical protein